MAVANILCDGSSQRRFHSEPMVEAIERLLHEKTLRNVQLEPSGAADELRLQPRRLRWALWLGGKLGSCAFQGQYCGLRTFERHNFRRDRSPPRGKLPSNATSARALHNLLYCFDARCILTGCRKRPVSS